MPIWTLVTRGDAPAAGPAIRPGADGPRAGAGAEAAPGGRRLSAAAQAGVAVGSVAGAALLVGLALLLRPIVTVSRGERGRLPACAPGERALQAERSGDSRPNAHAPTARRPLPPPTHPRVRAYRRPQERVLQRRNSRLTNALIGSDGACEITVLPPRSADNAFQLTDASKAKAKEGVV